MHELLKNAVFAICCLMVTACTSHYNLANVSHTRLVIDKQYDVQPNQTATKILGLYKAKVDSIMSPVLGHVAHDMAAERPESDLSNLLADILIWAAKSYNEKPVLAVYNVGGIRAALNKGAVTYGDVLAIAPFENKIAFTTLSGEKLMELFQQIAKKGGDGVSKGTELVIDSKGDLLSARLQGKEIEPTGQYRVTTIDYLVQGNDGLAAFKDGTNLYSPQDEHNNARFLIMDYFKEMEAKGQQVDSKVEGRIVVKDMP